jgi:hypothetical protein
MPSLTFLCAKGTVATVRIDDTVFHIDTNERIPGVYDVTLGKQLIPNIDVWLDGSTGHQYNMTILRKMVEAYNLGHAGTYSQSDVKEAMRSAITIATRKLFADGLYPDFVRLYSIENADAQSFDDLIAKIRTELPKAKSSDEKKELGVIIKRLHRASKRLRPGITDVLAKMLERLESQTGILDYSFSKQQTDQLVNDVFITMNTFPEYRGIREDIIKGMLILASQQRNVVEC